jgi:two-component system, cell cycle response regulator DivK
MTARILCVEDNPQNMRLVRKILKSQGYIVLEAEDGTSGLTMAETEKPDLILMDVNLPDIDGLEVTRRIKAQDHLHHIPIVALTANAMFGDEERCLAAGCDGYIAKPVSKQKLLSNLTSYLDPNWREKTREIDDAKTISNVEQIKSTLNQALVAKAASNGDIPKIMPSIENTSASTPQTTQTSEKLSAVGKVNRNHNFRKPTTKPSDDKSTPSQADTTLQKENNENSD